MFAQVFFHLGLGQARGFILDSVRIAQSASKKLPSSEVTQR